MADYLVSRIVSSVLSIPSETDPSKINTYNIFMAQNSGHCVLHEGKIVDLDSLQPGKDKTYIENEILKVATAIEPLSKLNK